MSHFYGTIQSQRGEATRCGSKNSGLTAVAASWEGAVSSYVWFNEELQEDWVTVELRTWHGAGRMVPLYCGPVSGRDAGKYMLTKKE